MTTNKSTESDALKLVQQDVKVLLHELSELKKLLVIKNEEDSHFRDLIIDFLVNKKEIKIGETTTVTKPPKIKKDETINIIVDVFYKNMYEFLKQNNDTHFDFVDEFTKININNIVNKLTDNSANNVRNCFIWCYSHINEIRIEVLTLPNIEQYINTLYNDKNELIKHNKTLTDLLKYEGNEVFKKHKDESYFKNYCVLLKQKYKKLI